MELYNDDCLKILKDIPSDSIDLIVTDPPYNINKADWDSWRNVEEYVVFLGSVFVECQRALKKTGSFYYFHNDFLQMVEIQNFINNNTDFQLNSFIIWVKENNRAISWKNPTEKNNLRSFFNICEFALFYTLQVGSGYAEYQEKTTESIRQYLNSEIKSARGRVDLKEINEALGVASSGGGMASHYFNSGQQAQIPTKEHYFKLQNWIGDNFLLKSYEDLKNEYEANKIKYEYMRYTHNLGENHNNVWSSNFVNNGKFHPCEKPIDIIERIINTSSNVGDTVLDCFMGSGTTGVACKLLDRHFIGIEKDEHYFNVAKERIKALDYRNLTLF